jgi:alpha-beta hydrolase superfamily lysophospholipase
MTLWEQIIAIYPELTDDLFENGTIVLQDDLDGQGAYIRQWSYSKPLPDGLKIGK